MLKELAARRRAEIDKTIAARDWPRAETLLVAEIERTQKPVDLLKMLAGVFMNERQPLNAAVAVKKAETCGPLDADSRLQLALTYISMRHNDWAPPELERLPAGDPLNAGYTYWLARLGFDSGRYAAAMDRLQTVVERVPGFMRASRATWNSCYEALNQPNKAIRQTPRGDPPGTEAGEKWPWPFLNLGIVLKKTGRVEEAEALFDEASQADPAFAPALCRLGAIVEGKRAHGRSHAGAPQCCRRGSVLRGAALRARAHLSPPGPHRGGRRDAGDVPTARSAGSEVRRWPSRARSRGSCGRLCPVPVSRGA